MMQQTPLVSVVIPCYKQAEYLAEAVKSVIAQTYSNWECIIIDDCSPDATEQVAKQLAALDNRIRIIKNEINKGLAETRNIGIKCAIGEFILPLDADDKIAPNYLFRSIKEFLSQPMLKLVYTDVMHFGCRNDILIRPEWNMRNICHQNLVHATAMYKKKDFFNTKGYQKNIYGYEDWDFWIQLIDEENEAFRINEPLFFYRVKEHSMITEIQKNRDIEAKNRLTIYNNNKEKFQEHFPELAYSYEKRSKNPDYLFLLKYLIRNKLKRVFGTSNNNLFFL